MPDANPPSEPAYARLRVELAKPDRSQAELARHLDLPTSSVSRALQTGRGFERHWPGIATYLGVSLDWLIFGHGAPGAAGGEIGSGAYRRVLTDQAERIAEQQVIIEHLMAEYRQLTGREPKLPADGRLPATGRPPGRGEPPAPGAAGR